MMQLGVSSNIALQQVEEGVDRLQAETRTLSDAVAMPSHERRDAVTREVASRLSVCTGHLRSAVSVFVTAIRTDLRNVVPDARRLRGDDGGGGGGDDARGSGGGSGGGGGASPYPPHGDGHRRRPHPGGGLKGSSSKASAAAAASSNATVAALREQVAQLRAALDRQDSEARRLRSLVGGGGGGSSGGNERRRQQQQQRRQHQPGETGGGSSKRDTAGVPPPPPPPPEQLHAGVVSPSRHRLSYVGIEDGALVASLFLCVESALHTVGASSAMLLLKHPTDDVLITAVTANVQQTALRTACYPCSGGAQADVHNSGIALNICPPPVNPATDAAGSGEEARRGGSTHTEAEYVAAVRRGNRFGTSHAGGAAFCLPAVPGAAAGGGRSGLRAPAEPRAELAPEGGGGAGLHYCRAAGLSRGHGLLIFPVYSSHPTQPVGVLQFYKKAQPLQQPPAAAAAAALLGEVGGAHLIQGEQRQTQQQQQQPRPSKQAGASAAAHHQPPPTSDLVFTEADERAVASCLPLRHLLRRCTERLGKGWFAEKDAAFHGGGGLSASAVAAAAEAADVGVSVVVPRFAPVQRVFRTRQSGKYVRHSQMLKAVKVEGKAGVAEVDEYMQHLEACWKQAADEWVAMESVQSSVSKDATQRRQRLRQVEERLLTTSREKDQYRHAYESLQTECRSLRHEAQPQARQVQQSSSAQQQQPPLEDTSELVLPTLRVA